MGNFGRIKKYLENIHYWLVSHLIPSRRYHMLDLRQPYIEHSEDSYRWGWKDAPEKMLYAMFNLLGEYLEEEEHMERFLATLEKEEPFANYEIDEDQKELIRKQEENLREAKLIHHWWLVERKKAQKVYMDKLSKWYDLYQLKGDDPEVQKLSEENHKLEDELEAKTDEMIARLMKIRRTLWT